VNLTIVYGTQSGNARNLAHVIGESLESQGFSAPVLDMGEVDPEEILFMKHVVIVTSTYGDGEPPDNASEWMSFLKFGEELNLNQLSYAVIGLGDPYYPHFCQCGKDFDHYLSKWGAHAMLNRLDCDLYYEEQYPEWVNELIEVLKNDLQE
jgi:sulfite reductase (NADPH) flavoprotein alpha-component